MTGGLSNTGRRCLLVSCHPLADSLCNHLATRVEQAFAGHPVEVERLDLYRAGFDAPLTAAERTGYFAGSFDDSALGEHTAQLQRAEILVLVFPTWWFGLPALMKGWFDRVWAPGIAFDHPSGPGGRIAPRLDGLRHCLAVTTLGSPWWFDRFVMRRPLRRILRTGLIGTCAPSARFDMLSLYGVMALDQPRLDRFLARIDAAVQRIVHDAPADVSLPRRAPP